jgi:hypothetical protein
LYSHLKPNTIHFADTEPLRHGDIYPDRDAKRQPLGDSIVYSRLQRHNHRQRDNDPIGDAFYNWNHKLQPIDYQVYYTV